MKDLSLNSLPLHFASENWPQSLMPCLSFSLAKGTCSHSTNFHIFYMQCHYHLHRNWNWMAGNSTSPKTRTWLTVTFCKSILFSNTMWYLFSTIKLILLTHQAHTGVWREKILPGTEPHEWRLQYRNHFRWVGPRVVICGQQMKHHFHSIFHCFVFPATRPKEFTLWHTTIYMNIEEKLTKNSYLFWKGHYQS